MPAWAPAEPAVDGARWRRVGSLFEAALQYPADARAGFLEQACGGDRALLDEVSSLLSRHAATDPLLDGASALRLPRDPLAPAADAMASAVTGLPGRGDGTAFDSLASGTWFGPYQIERLLGVGGMGEVYLARDSRLHRSVALKLLGRAFDPDPRMVERFRQEALAASALSHPNIPKVFEAGVHDGRHFIAAEYVEGMPLWQRLQQGPLPWRSAVDVAETLARVLDSAHRAGIVHRDVKPGNILLDSAGRPHLVDFGIAKLIVTPAIDTATRQLTVAGALVGTPGYMAPEQLVGEPVGPAADIWALAAVLHEMVTGSRPLAGTDRRRSRHDMPAGLARILDRALQRNPLDRFPDAAALAEALARLRRERASWLSDPGWRLGAGVGALLLGLLGGAWQQGWFASRPVTPAVPSLAVLPFENLGPDRGDGYFAAGLQDELLTRLSHVSGLRVLDRHATEHGGATPADWGPLARRLQVDHLLAGSVQRHDGRVLVHVRLIEPATAAQVWAERYERDAQDVFAIEREVAEGVALRLNAQLHPAERDAMALVDTRNPLAHEYSLKGRYLYRHGDEASLRGAVAAFERAVALDPSYAQAYADLALARHNLDDFLSGDHQDNRARSRAAARQAIALAPDLPDGHVALGWDLKFWDWDLAGARREFERADALAPNSPRAINGLAALRMDFGEFRSARVLFERARDLDPLSGTTLNNLANLMLALRDWDAAERLSREALQLEPNLESGHANLAYVALARGDRGRALVEAQAEPSTEWRDFMVTLVRQVQGSKAEVDRLQRDYERRHGEASPFMTAALYARRAQADAAFTWLGRAAAARDASAIEVLSSPDFADLHADPRLSDFCRSIGLPDPRRIDR